MAFLISPNFPPPTAFRRLVAEPEPALFPQDSLPVVLAMECSASRLWPLSPPGQHLLKVLSSLLRQDWSHLTHPRAPRRCYHASGLVPCHNEAPLLTFPAPTHRSGLEYSAAGTPLAAVREVQHLQALPVQGQTAQAPQHSHSSLGKGRGRTMCI